MKNLLSPLRHLVTVVPYTRQGRSEFQKDGHYRTGRRVQLAPVAGVVNRPCKIVKESLLKMPDYQQDDSRIRFSF